MSEAQRKRIIARDGGRCFYCLRKAKKVHIEHRVARVNGGTDDDSNLVVSCQDCNLRKARSGPEWTYKSRRKSTLPSRTLPTGRTLISRSWSKGRKVRQ